MTAQESTEMVRRWLPALLVAFGLAASWGSFQTQLDVMADEIADIKAKGAGRDDKDSASEVQVEVLKSNQQAIKDDIEEIKKDQKEFQKETNKKLDEILKEIRQRD